MVPQIQINSLTHPEYSACLQDWLKWRLTYKGGRAFIDRYLRKFSLREDNTDFAERKIITYCPRFAGAAVDEVKNSIYQRMVDITRVDGPRSYLQAVEGKINGVDLRGNSMNSFIAEKILPELLTMKRIGVFVDMPVLKGPSVADTLDARPYLYTYQVEDIRNWIVDEKNENQFEQVLLRDNIYTYDVKTGFPVGTTTRFRHLFKKDGIVGCQIYNDKCEEVGEMKVLNIPKIPFYIFEISNSLLEDIADYQIALMNLASSDIAFSLKANFPFYIEQFDPRAEASAFLRYEGDPTFDSEGNETGAGTAAQAEKAGNNDVKVGVSSGRRYPLNTDAPAFIHPSAEPMKISMEKQEQLKKEIRLLLNLGLANIKTVGMASAESKKEDNRSLESGLSNIGLTLEKGEREIASIWAMYEGNRESPTVKYPINYSLRSEDERREEATELEKLMKSIPSPTYQREMGKTISRIMLGHYVAQPTLEKIDGEIDNAVNMVSDPEIVAMDVENGLVDPETASKLRGYPEGTAEKAEEAHARRLARIAEAQAVEANNAGARGVGDLSGSPGKEGSSEKKASRDNTRNNNPGRRVRGKGKSLNRGSRNE